MKRYSFEILSLLVLCLSACSYLTPSRNVANPPTQEPSTKSVGSSDAPKLIPAEWSQVLDHGADFATIVLAFFAAGTLFFGLRQFKQTQRLARENLNLQSDSFEKTQLLARENLKGQSEALKHEREIKAIELFLRFNELNYQIASNKQSMGLEAAFWQNNALLSITESVFRLTEGDAAWEETVRWMLEAQKSFLIQNKIKCKSFSELFTKKIKEVIPTLECEP